MLHDVPDVAFTGVLLHIEKVAVKPAPEQRIFVAFYCGVMYELPRVDLHVTGIQRIAEIHQVN